MNIVIIGTGNVASVFGKAFKNAGHTILQVAGRDSMAASDLAYELDTFSTNYWSQVDKTADVYIIAVSDNSIAAVGEELKLAGKIVAHTAAAVPKDVLKNISEHYGVFYPLQSLRKEMAELPVFPVFVDGSDNKTQNTLEELARSIAGEKVAVAGYADRVKLHVAAVFVNNFTNYLYTLAEEYCKKEGLDFKLLQPIIEETALRSRSVSPKDVQTGPAIRHDSETIQKHLFLLQQYPKLQEVYKFLSDSIEELK